MANTCYDAIAMPNLNYPTSNHMTTNGIVQDNNIYRALDFTFTFKTAKLMQIQGIKYTNGIFDVLRLPNVKIDGVGEE